jgi:hypothetical protein
MTCMREHGTRAEAGTVNIPGDGIAGRGPARLHRRPATDRRKSKGLPGPTCQDSRCAESPSSPRRGEDRREGACGDHGRPPHHAAHLAIAATDRRDHAELTVLAGFHQDLAAEATAPPTGCATCLTQLHPSLERVLGPCLDHQGVSRLLERYGSPAALRTTGRRQTRRGDPSEAPRMAQRLIDDLYTQRQATEPRSTPC